MAHAFSAFVLLVSGSLLAKTTMTYSNKNALCKFLETVSSDARCYQLIIGVVSFD